ncbi:MAG: hypothetical protein L0Y80_01005 [Ignavibacteriae bacterium]|nr:hypothetical protein [Ignavibacteriota bacterium]
MQETKPWYESTTIRGIIITALSTILSILALLGVNIGVGEPEVTAVVTGVTTLVGTVVAVIGRVKASAAITLKKRLNH